MDPAIRARLESADEPAASDRPREFDPQTLRERVLGLRAELTQITGDEFYLDDDAQLAAFFGDLSSDFFTVRFSNFGSLFTTWSHGGQKERYPDELIAELVQAVSLAGFRYVTMEQLETPYTGRHKHVATETWWDRFFEW